MTWQWLHKFGSPKWFYEKTTGLSRVLLVASLIAVCIGLVWGLLFAPEHVTQKHSYRIIYIHVPTSFLSMAGFFFMAVCGAIGLIWRTKMSFILMQVAAPVGAVFTFLSLFTGAVWGKPTWGTYWEWDARITFQLILFFLYLAIIALNSAYRNRAAADKVCAVLAIIGSVNIPLIYWSVEWWFTLHQTATFKMSGKSGIHASMAYPLVWMIFSTYALYIALILQHARVEILSRESMSRWVKQLVDKKA